MNQFSGFTAGSAFLAVSEKSEIQELSWQCGFTFRICTWVVSLERTILDEGGNAFRWLKASQHPEAEEGDIR